MRPARTKSPKLLQLCLTLAIHIMECTSRRQPMPSLRSGSRSWTRDPNWLLRCSRSLTSALIEAKIKEREHRKSQLGSQLAFAMLPLLDLGLYKGRGQGAGASQKPIGIPGPAPGARPQGGHRLPARRAFHDVDSQGQAQLQ